MKELREPAMKLTTESGVDDLDRGLKFRMLQFEEGSLVRHVVQVLRDSRSLWSALDNTL